MSGARDLISFLQKYYSERTGIDLHILKQQAESVWKSQVALGRLSTSALDQLYSVGKRPEVTDNDVHAVLLPILNWWDRLCAANKPEITQIKDSTCYPSNLVIGTARTGSINAQAIQAEDGSKGILLETDLFFWLVNISNLLARILIEESPDAFYLHSPFDDSIYKRSELEIKAFAHQLRNHLVYGRAEWGFDTADVQLGEPKFLLLEGAVYFILGHELAHLTKSHHDRFIKREDFVIPNGYGEAFGKYEERYEEQYPGLTMEESIDAIIRFGLEIEADYYGQIYGINAQIAQLRATPFGKNTTPTGLLRLTGHLSFLWFVELRERAIRVLINGDDCLDDPIYSKDFLVQDLLFRKTHPSPLTRLHFLQRGYPDLELAFGFTEALFEGIWQTTRPIMVDGHINGERLLHYSSYQDKEEGRTAGSMAEEAAADQNTLAGLTHCIL